MKPTLGYWHIRGRVNPVRMLLHYAGEDFVDKRYSDYNEWFGKDKINLPLDFPNLPYYMDGTVKMTQTRSILQYLGRKHHLDGTSEAELARMGVIFDQVNELSVDLGGVAYPPEVDNKKEIHDMARKKYVEALDDKLGAIAKFLGKDDWMAGKRLTYVDFFIYDVLDKHRCLFLPKHLNKFPALIAYMIRIENLKGVKEYLNSDAFKPMPIFGPFAFFGNSEDFVPNE